MNRHEVAALIGPAITTRGAARIVPIAGDFTRPTDLDALGREPLDGALVANALHFVRDAGAVLARIAECIRPAGRVVVVEYDRRGPDRWVPYPIPPARLEELTAAAGLGRPTVIGTRRSAFGGVMYAAVAVAVRGDGEVGSGRPGAGTRVR